MDHAPVGRTVDRVRHRCPVFLYTTNAASSSINNPSSRRPARHSIAFRRSPSYAPSSSILQVLRYSLDLSRMRETMEQGAGLLKVIILKGNDLAIRDFRSSDPYVVTKLGKQIAKTKVINCCLNPVWNEELTFCVKEPVGVLRLEVFDRDRFKFDDKMGHTFLDLRPLASSSMLKRALKLTTGETKLRKVAPDSDNCLLSDSFIKCVNGEIILDARLRLRDVESGELSVSIKWIDSPTTAASAKKC